MKETDKSTDKERKEFFIEESFSIKEGAEYSEV